MQTTISIVMPRKQRNVQCVVSKDTKSSLPSLETSDGRLIVESKEKANLLAEMFAAIAQFENLEIFPN